MRRLGTFHLIGDNHSVPQPLHTEAPTNITLAITGASGSIYAAELLRALAADDRVTKINFVASDSALRVFAEELNLSGRNDLAEKLLGAPCPKLQQHAETDIAANIASGSYPTAAMIVLPCSMGTLASIANGLAQNLIHRAADVCLKENRPLILCIRETPFNRIHIRNMQLASDAGATIFPAIPTLYNHPQSTQEMARNFIHRVLAHIGLSQPNAYQWQPD
ncbi:UbiX family flavin prenyltransferase [Tunturiibacter empetritectus]|uniref:Flavin prenyltransferase UbiX n=2 Tax=Tunturiibacter TaxID=3154218 RepID=A0A852VFN3_9BACT|nr:UbiX family flavin prenyltransferase [Edaphobacter lichenicola]NYF89055.1 4-hydroxy-3-polyprenylbenzoate decarboxylase [Edaphobacter lichenicola]